MTDNITKRAYDLAEKEIEEKEISKVKEIVKDYLKELQEKEVQSKKITKEISLLKKDLDDLKAGRLDRIAERQKIEPSSPKIMIIKIIEKTYVPMQPWYSPFEIVYPVYKPNPFLLSSSGTAGYQTGYSSSMTLASGGGNTTAFYTAADCGETSLVNCMTTGSSSGASQSIVGNTFRNFAGGAYDLGAGNIINL